MAILWLSLNRGTRAAKRIYSLQPDKKKSKSMHVLAAVLLGAVVSTITIDEECAQTCTDIVEGYDNLYPKDEVCYNLNTGECNKRSGDTCGRAEVDCLVRANINQGNNPMDLARGFEYLPGRWISHSYLDFLHCVKMDKGECTTDEDCTWKDVEYSTIVNSKHLSSEEDVVTISTNPYVTHPDDALRGAVISTSNDVLRRSGQCVNNNAFIQMRNFQSIGHFGKVKPDKHSNDNAMLFGDHIETLKKGDTISILAGKEVTLGEVIELSTDHWERFASVLWTGGTKFYDAPYTDTDTDYTKVTWKSTTEKVVAYSCPSPSFVVHLDVTLPEAGNYARLDDVLVCIDGDELQKHGSDTTAGANPFESTYAYKHNYQAFYNAETPFMLVGSHTNPLFDTSELSVLIHDKIKKIQVTEWTNLRSIDVRTHTCHPSLREVSIFTKYTKLVHPDSDFIFAGVFTACVPVTCEYPQLHDSAAEKEKKCTRNLGCVVHDVKTYKKSATATGIDTLWAAESGTKKICAPNFYKFADPTTNEYAQSQCKYSYDNFHEGYKGLIGNGGDNSNRFHLAPYPHGSVGVFFNDLQERIAIDFIDMTEGAAVCISFQNVECQSAATGTPARFACPLNNNGFYQSLTCDKLQQGTPFDCGTWTGTGPLDKWDVDNPPYPTLCTEYCGSTDECIGKGDTLSCDANPAVTGPFTCKGKETACGDCFTEASAKFLAPDVPCGHLDPPEDTTTSTTTIQKTANHDATCSEQNKCEDCHGTCNDDNQCSGTGATCVLLSATHCDGTATKMVCASENYLTSTATATTTTTTATTTTEVTTTTTNTNTTFVGDCCNVRDHTIIATETGTCDTSQKHIKFTAVGACIEGTWSGHRAWILIPLTGPLIFLLGAWIIEAVVGVDAEGLKKVRASGSAMFLLAVIACVGLQWHAASDDVPGGILAVRIVAIVAAAVSAGILAAMAVWQKDFNFEPILPPLVLANASNEFNAAVRVVFQYMHAATAWLVYGIAARMVYREMDTTKLLTEVVGEDVRAPLMIVAIGLGLQALPLRAFLWSPGKEKESEPLLAVAMRGINWFVLLSFFGASLYSFSSILDSPVDRWKFAAVVATSVVWGFYSFLVPSIAYEQPNYIKGELLLRIVATVLILVGGSMLHEQLDRTHPDKNAVQTFIEADHFLHAAFIAVLVYMIALLILDVALFIFSLCKAEKARDKYTGFEKLMQTTQWNW